ncbi:SusC/RagA family TonB-linked outer membrane protein [Chitinophaga oryzae]|uniref:SusC/RagA family TonB-linked outer membrane protein n=1 Tax=Chitinophaga oryzae TaxID=2725414 RepID=A0ABX6LG42_9BACT|nr:SusC/RagA family TonB-linked outer membrane protein [Chitinophaga oryzae]QJB39075.1 SusC/RagA family TonB-linked outer membrane protein [Chitinophaga oryzae]
MKLIALLFLFNLQVTASVYSQRISLTASNTPLRDVLQSVRKQSGYSFFVESDNLRDSKPVNLNLWDNSVPEALDKIFENQPFTYTIQNNVIVVTRKQGSNLSAADFLTFDSGAPDSTKVVYVQGSVRDDKGQPLVGVSVRVKGSGTGTVTKPDGTYTLKTNAAATLIFSYIGYLSREIKAQQGEIDVVLKQLNTALDQVQVIAYGTTTKRTSTGNIGTVDAETLEKQPVSNPLLALQGRVPGIFIEQTTGLSGGSVNVSIQGVNSIKQGTVPFIVVDGVPFPSSDPSGDLAAGAFPSTLNGINTLTLINPNDIESVTILKDADATAIYGSRAANGAILITTKKGKPGKTLIDINLQSGFGKIPRYLKLLNTKDYITLRKEAKENDNAPITISDYDINGTWDTTKNINWQKELVGGTARYSNLQASISGGTENSHFFISGGYLRETTVFPGDLGDTKVNVHTNINHRSSNQKFTFNISTTYIQDDNRLFNADIMRQAVLLPSNAPDPYNSDGTLNWGKIPGTEAYSFDNPMAYLLRKYTGNTNNLLANSNIGYQILPGLQISASLGYNKIQSAEKSLTPQSSFDPSFPVNIRRNMTANRSQTSWILEPQVKYKKESKYGDIEILIGSSFQQKRSSALTAIASGFIDDAQIENIANATSTMLLPSEITYRYNGLFGRLNYSYGGKYVLTIAGRRDGTTRFGSANRFANFYSMAGAWIFSEEEFLKHGITFLTLGKIKASYGTTGNDQISDFLYLPLYTNVSTPIQYQQAQGLRPVGHSNPYLQWELTKKINIGLDLAFINNRIQFSGNYYFNRSSNQLLSYPLGLLTGFSGVNKNIDAVIQNNGIELSLDATLHKYKNFAWSASVNFTSPQNKLVRFPNLDQTPLAQTYVIGMPLAIAKVYPFLGVNPQTGLYEYQSSDGKATSSPDYTKDRTQIIKLNPQYYGGVSNTITYKSLTLDFLFQFVKKNQSTDRYTFVMQGTSANLSTSVNDRWHKPGDKATYQKASSGQDFNALMAYYSLYSSAAAYEDASYIKLKNISITYTIPSSILKPLKISSATISLLGQNIFTLSNFFGISPESPSITTLPPLRTVTAGIRVTL